MLRKFSLLQVLDLSYNKLTRIEGLSGLPIQELNLKGNNLTDLAGLGIGNLPRLTALNVAENAIKTLKPLEDCKNLDYLDVCNNKIEFIRQVEFLQNLPFLQILYFEGNQGSLKKFYRYRIIFRLPKLEQLDETKVSAEEKIRSANAYKSVDGDLESRRCVFNKFLPDEEYIDYSPQLEDEEMLLTLEELMAGENFEQREAKALSSKNLYADEAEAFVDNVIRGSLVLVNTKSEEQQVLGKWKEERVINVARIYKSI